jgi:hypothetical protein
MRAQMVIQYFARLPLFLGRQTEKVRAAPSFLLKISLRSFFLLFAQ